VKSKPVSICCFVDGLNEYPDDRALVAVDVIRATTTAVTAISMGWECHVVPTLQAALDAASRLPNALLTGEVGGEMPTGFELMNSPAQLAARSDVSRPLVLLSSNGTRLMHGIRHSESPPDLPAWNSVNSALPMEPARSSHDFSDSTPSSRKACSAPVR